jgi:uncharacterized membrane protein
VPSQRLAFLDWTRGAAVVIMIVCHAFNALASPDARAAAAYKWSQLVGGMAAVLFLFVAGMTFAMGMKPGRGLATALRRGAWVLGFAYVFRIVNWVCDSPRAPWQSILRVDILNCMGAVMLLMAPVALLDGRRRLFAALAAAAGFAAGAPYLTYLDWSGAPMLLAEYLRPRRGGFSLFPYGAYLAFGIAAAASTRLRPEGADWGRWMRGAAAAAALLLLSGWFGDAWIRPLLPVTDYWTDDPSLALLRTGLVLLLLVAAWHWTQSVAGWSPMQTLGRESLLVYWAHLAIVYGLPLRPWRESLGINATAAVTLAVIAGMTALAYGRLAWKQRGTPLHAADPLRRG